MNYWETPDFQARLMSVRYEGGSRTRIDVRTGLTVPELIERGWSKFAIKPRLGRPDQIVQHPPDWKGLHWYKMDRIVAAEQTPGWRKHKRNIRFHTLLEPHSLGANGWRVGVWVRNQTWIANLWIRKPDKAHFMLLQDALWVRDCVRFKDTHMEYRAREFLETHGILIPSRKFSAYP